MTLATSISRVLAAHPEMAFWGVTGLEHTYGAQSSVAFEIQGPWKPEGADKKKFTFNATKDEIRCLESTHELPTFIQMVAPVMKKKD